MNKRQYKKKIKGYNKINIHTFSGFQTYHYCINHNITIDKYRSRLRFLSLNDHRNKDEQEELTQMTTSCLIEYVVMVYCKKSSLSQRGNNDSKGKIHGKRIQYVPYESQYELN